MPGGKPAGVRCIQLDDEDRCRIFGQPERPAVCGSLQPSEMMCGDSREQAMRWLGWMEAETAPARPLFLARHGPTHRASHIPQAQHREANADEH